MFTVANADLKLCQNDDSHKCVTLQASLLDPHVILDS